MITATPSAELPAAKKQRKPNAPAPKPAKEIRCEILTAAHYDEWNDLVDASPHGTIFHYSWWLEGEGEDFEILAVRNERGALEAGMPLSFRGRRGFRLVRAPKFTRYLGPIFKLNSADNTCDQLHLMRSLGEILARKVKGFDSFRCVASPRTPDLQGFLWAGFAVRLSYAFRFPAGRTLDEVLAGMSQAHQHDLRKATRMDLTVACENEAEECVALARPRRSANAVRSWESFVRIWNSARSKDRARLYVARDAKRNPVAALFTVNDDHTTYELLSADDGSSPETLASHLLLWTALQECVQGGREFEFETRSFRNDDGFYRRWGAAAVPIFRLEKAGSWRGGLLHSWANRRNAVAAIR